MGWIDERAILKLLKKNKTERRVKESDLNRAEAALLTGQGEASTEYSRTYLLKTVEELLPLFIEEIRRLKKELQNQRSAAKRVAQIYDSMKSIRGSSQAEKLLAKSIAKLSLGNLDEESDDNEGKT